MPLHDWSKLSGWEGVHLLWMTELLRQIKAELPPGYRAYLGSGPGITVGAPPGRPDVSVREHALAGELTQTSGHLVQGPALPEPDVEIAVATLEVDTSLRIQRDDRLISIVELISPRNKDRRVARAAYTRRYAGYLMEGIHLMLVDVHPLPGRFSFADAIARELSIPNQPVLPSLLAISYRVGEPAAEGGRLLAIWRQPLKPSVALSPLPLALNTEFAIGVDLEATYQRAASDAYLS